MMKHIRMSSIVGLQSIATPSTDPGVRKKRLRTGEDGGDPISSDISSKPCLR